MYFNVACRVVSCFYTFLFFQSRMRFCSENQRRRPHEIRTWLTWRTKEYFFLKDNTNVHTTYTNTPCPCMFRFLLTIVTTRHHRLYLHQCFQRLRIFCSDQHLFDWQLYRNITGPSMARCFIDLDPETTEVHLLSALLQCRLKEPRYMLSVKLKPLHLMVLFETGIVDDWHCWFALDWIQQLEKHLL